VEQNERILILGTGLTMVDYVLSLILAGHEGPIVALSRRGLLPHAHRSIQPLPIDQADVPFGTDMTELMRWLRKLINGHVEHGGDWRSVVDGNQAFQSVNLAVLVDLSAAQVPRTCTRMVGRASTSNGA